ncbi:MAG TPA: ACT domain-containing protein [Tepidisphaeraceae bacterium]|nr:ACT domain-containing protein [Tepidisphaeraceae bacterium]
MTQHAILTAIGTDRPGLVDEVSAFIFERQGNIEDSRMVNLRGQFAIMVLVAGSEQTLSRLRSEVWQLAQKSGLQAELRPATAMPTPATAEAIPYHLKATAIDQPGLVHRFSHLLRSLQVNIESLETQLAAAPITGAPLFEMEIVLSVPRSTSISKLREGLGNLCNELNIDWELERM